MEIKDLYLSIEGKQILKDISFSMADNEIITVFGPSGCGKTSLLKSILGIHNSDGSIILNGNEVNGLSISERDISIVFQEFAMFPHLTVYENLKIILNNNIKIKQLLIRFELEHLSGRYPSTLSGGESQRVAIARALLTMPKLLLLDEPFSNVDNITKSKIERDIRKILTDLKIPTIIVTHNKHDAFFMSDRAIIMNNGRIEQIGDMKTLYERPINNFVAGLLGEFNIVGDYMVRPEWVHVSKSTDNSGFRVLSSSYYGMYNRLIISDGSFKNTVIVYDIGMIVEKGDSVILTINKNHKLKGSS